ncbi:MAG: hypothetical protein ACR2H3_00815 [Acidimicrobiales bacterium]
MLAAELEIRHSRHFSPTRRVALGRLWLPTDPAPGPGGLLLAGIVAAGCSALDDDEDALEGVDGFLNAVESGQRIVQPRVRYRYQADTHGLDRSTHRLIHVPDEDPELEIDGHGAVIPQVLGAIYAAAQLSPTARPQVFRLFRRATRWTGGIDRSLVAFLGGDEAGMLRRRDLPNDERWARQVLGFGPGAEPGRGDILARFRELVREAHPDHGGKNDAAGRRMVELTEARRILTGA